MTTALESRLRICDHVHSRRFDNELVLLDLKGGNYYGIDEIGARAWDAFAKGQSLSEIVEPLMVEWAVSREVLEHDLQAFASELLAKGLVEWAPA